jgi:hypothetical protein
MTRQVALSKTQNTIVHVEQTGGAFVWAGRWDGEDHSGYVWDQDQIDADVRRAFTGEPAAPILAYGSRPSLTAPIAPTGSLSRLASPVAGPTPAAYDIPVENDTMSFVPPEQEGVLIRMDAQSAEARVVDEHTAKFVGSLRNSQGHYWTPVAKELAFGVIYGKPIPQEATSPLYCEHANEMPHPCPCPEYCYCRVVGNCGQAPRKGELVEQPATMHKLPPGTAKEISRRVEERRK